MNYTLKNKEIEVTVSSKGAEVLSVKRGACEYIWQGDPKYWGGQTPLLFPICGRLNDGVYTYGGKKYEMILHGFARKIEFECLSQSDTELVLGIEASEETRKIYPFEFSLVITYRLYGERLEMTATIKNLGDVTMPATFGGHPGFRVPFGGDTDFSEWYLEFDEECDPDRIEIAPSGLQSGIRTAYPLKDHRILPLSHELFVTDGIFLSRMARKVTLKCDRSDRSVTLDYPDMPYLGIWQTEQSDAPFICIEPWCGLPDFDGKPFDFDQKSQMFHIAPKAQKVVGFDMSFQ